jgi:hypothetical protein
MRPIGIAGTALSAFVLTTCLCMGVASAQTTTPTAAGAPSPPTPATSPSPPELPPAPAAAPAVTDDKPVKPICHYVDVVGTAVRKKICH